MQAPRPTKKSQELSDSILGKSKKKNKLPSAIRRNIRQIRSEEIRTTR